MIEGMGESLFNVLRITCRGLEGRSASLDKSLSQLRTHMMNSEGSLPDELVNKIEQDIHVLELERQENSQDFAEVSSAWMSHLRNTELAEQQKKQLADIGAAFKDADGSIYKLPAKFKLLLDLQLAADRLLEQVESDGSAQLPLKKIAAEFIQLLAQITPSKELLSKHKILISQLEEGLELENLPSVISRITSIIEAERAVKSEDFSRYLKGLNGQLNEVQGFITKTKTVDSANAKVRLAADETIRDSVSSIRLSAEGSSKIEELQDTLSEQLKHIVGAVDSLKEAEKKRDDSLLVNYRAMKKRIEVMEQEAEKVQEFIEEERKQARKDALTGLPNRTAYNEIMAHQIEQFNRYKEPLTLVVCDLDYFKLVNDSYGHLAGDKVLSLVAKILAKTTRNADHVTRYGGEEFAIVLPSTQAEQAARTMDKIRRLICKSPFNYRGEPISISMSFGVCEAQEGDSIESLFSRADVALYKAKENGRNNVCIG